MRVYINKYRDHWLSPYTIMEPILFWKRWTDPEFDLYDDKNKHYTDWLITPCTWLQKFLDIVHPKIDYVKIDYWDTWSMDYTLAKIVLPMLKRLQSTKHGSPLVDLEDVPEYMRTDETESWDDQLTFDFYSTAERSGYDIHDRWNWVLNEMIFAFECALNEDWSDEFYSGNADWTWVKTDKSYPNPITGKEEYLSQMVKGPNHTYKCDYDGMKVVQNRIDNGFRLFGKYYQGLWD